MPEIQEGSGRASPHPPAMDHHFPSDNVLFNKYELGKLLGRGAFAKVYHAKNVANGQGVAIKVINKSQISANLNLMANIKREISIMSKLRHPNIVKLFEVLATRTKIYFVMEYVKGGELFAKIAKGRFGEDLSRKYFQEMISAVSYCHSRGVYHRDLKPENLLLDENGNLKVSDFGLGALTDQVRPDGLLHTLCGTPAYVAPEILSKKGYEGAHVDVWSCGIVLYVLTAGFLPFNDSNLMNMYKKIYRGEFRCPKWMSPDLKRFLSRLLNTNPRTRITIEEIKRDPWFKKGYKDVIMKFDDQVEQDFGRFVNAEDKKLVDLNAFDIISFSSGLDLSGLFDERCRAVADVERLSVEDTPEGVLQKVEEVVKGASCGVRVRKLRECSVEVEGQDGNFVMGVDVYRLADRLTVVEVRRKGGDADVLWREKIRPVIIEQRELQVAGC